MHRKLLLKSNTNNINRFNIGTFVAINTGVRGQGSGGRNHMPGRRDRGQDEKGQEGAFWLLEK